MIIYLLDTNAISDLMREEPRITSRLSAALASDRIVTSVIARGEILYGLQRMPGGKRKNALEARAAAIFALVPCEDVPASAAIHYAQIKATQQKLGFSVDENDLWIAASASSLGAIVVSRDSDLHRIGGLAIIDWAV